MKKKFFSALIAAPLVFGAVSVADMAYGMEARDDGKFPNMGFNIDDAGVVKVAGKKVGVVQPETLAALQAKGAPNLAAAVDQLVENEANLKESVDHMLVTFVKLQYALDKTNSTAAMKKAMASASSKSETDLIATIYNNKLRAILEDAITQAAKNKK